MRTVLLLIMVAICLVAAEQPIVQHPAEQQNGYRLFPGDLVRIDVYDNNDLSMPIRIPASGSVSYPLIGTLDHLAERTIDQLTEDMRVRLEDGFLRHAQVTITVLEHGPRAVYVIGGVTRPGPVALNPAKETSLLQALGDAGGYLDDAARDATVVMRRHLDQMVAIHPSATGESGQDLQLLAGDVIIVPRLDRVYVTGEVKKPGAVSIPAEGPLTVTRAITLAGGFERFAKQGNVLIMRGTEEPHNVDAAALFAGEKNLLDPILKPGDSVFVPQSRF